MKNFIIKWAPTVTTVALGIISATSCSDKVAASPVAAVAVGTVYAIVKGLLPSPVAKPDL